MRRSQDYHAHILEVQRSPSILTDVPRYPTAHLAFGKKVVHEEDEGRCYGHPHDGERVEVIQYEQTTNPENGVREVAYEENVDVEHDQYYPRRRGGFELQKWKTFRP